MRQLLHLVHQGGLPLHIAFTNVSWVVKFLLGYKRINENFCHKEEFLNFVLCTAYPQTKGLIIVGPDIQGISSQTVISNLALLRI